MQIASRLFINTGRKNESGKCRQNISVFPIFALKRPAMALQDKYINPFTDFGFKKLFGSEPNKDLLIDFPIQEQAKKGDWNYQLAAVYMVGILDFTFSEDESEREVRHEVQLKDQKCRIFYDKLTYIYLEMPNFSKAEADLQNNFDKWMYILQQLPYLQNRPQALQERVFQKLFEAAEIAKFTPDEKNKYEESLKYYRDLKNVVDTSFDEGKAEGKAEGKDERSIEIARQMKAKGMHINMIAEITGLSIAEIEKV